MGLTCKICFENASSQGPQSMHARITPCGHVFCQPCATTWFGSDAACPVCRRPLQGLSSLIPLYDQDAGLQSSTTGFFDGNTETTGDVSNNGPAQIVDHGSRDCQFGGRINCSLQNAGIENATLGDGTRTKGSDERDYDLFHKHGGESEELHVRYVLGKVAERWQQVMVERAKLKVQVARLERTKQELLSQLQRMDEENAALTQMVGEKSRAASRGRTMEYRCLEELEREHEVWETRFLSEIGRHRRERETEESPISVGHCREFCDSRMKTYLRQKKGPLVKPPAKVLERLGAKNWELVHTFAMHSSPVHGIAVNPCGNLIATASWDHLCKIYDIHLEEEVAVLSGHELGLYAVKFSPSKRDIVGTVSSDHTCRLWNADTAECLRVLEGHSDEVCVVVVKKEYVVL